MVIDDLHRADEALLRLLAYLEITEFTNLSFAANDTDDMVVTHFAAAAPSPASPPPWTLTIGDVSAMARSNLYRGTEDTARKPGPPIGHSAAASSR